MINRPRLSFVMNNIYIPKFKAKSYASYLYAGENNDTYRNYQFTPDKNFLFNNKDRSRDDLILGIECSFDDSACGIVSSFGEVKSHIKKSYWGDQYEVNQGVNPASAKEHH